MGSADNNQSWVPVLIQIVLTITGGALLFAYVLGYVASGEFITFFPPLAMMNAIFNVFYWLSHRNTGNFFLMIAWLVIVIVTVALLKI